MSPLIHTRALLLLACLLVAGCGGNKNVTSEEVEAVKKDLEGGLSEEMKKAFKWDRFEGMDDPNNKKIKYIWAMYRVEGPLEMLLKLEDGKVVARSPNAHGEKWQENISKVKW
jgi:hypothetical protein